MKKMLKYSFSIGMLILISSGLFAQTKRIKGLRLGVDLSRFSLYYVAPEREGYEFSGDFEILKNIYLTAEYGKEDVNLEKDTYNYYSEGTYFRAGFDRNFMKSNNPDVYEMVFVGFRYGYAAQEHYSENISIKNPYWQGSALAIVPETTCTTHWMEIVAGIRAELIRNVALGWSVRGRIRLNKTGYNNLEPYNVPGFGNGFNKANLGFNFSLYIRIPFYKQTVDYSVKTTD